MNWASSYFMMLKCCHDTPSTVFLDVSQQHGVKSILWQRCMVDVYSSSVVVTWWCQQYHWCWSDTILAVWWWVFSHHIIIISSSSIILLTVLHLLHLNCYHSYSASRHLVYFTTVFDVFKHWKQNFWIWNHSVRTVSWIFF